VSAERYCEASHWLAENGAHHPTLKSALVIPIRQRVTYKLTTLVHKCVNGRASEYLAEFCHTSVDRRPAMRSADNRKLHIPRTQTSFNDRAFAVAGPRTWNNLPDAIGIRL